MVGSTNNEVLFNDPFLQVERDPENGHRIVRTTNAAAVLIFDRRSESVVLIEQDRSAMKTPDNPQGRVTEVVAGRFDIDGETVQVMLKREIKEETGIEIEDESRIRIINWGKPMASSPGFATEQVYSAFVEVDLDPDELKRTKEIFGAVDEGEKITRKFVSVYQLPEMVFDNQKTFGLIMWFFGYLSKQGWELHWGDC